MLNIWAFWWSIITINYDNDDDDEANDGDNDDNDDDVDANDGAHPLHLLLDGGHCEGGLGHLGGLDAPPECHQ